MSPMCRGRSNKLEAFRGASERGPAFVASDAAFEVSPKPRRVAFEVEAPDQDALAFEGIRNITAKDDRGTVLVHDYGFVFSAVDRGSYPDEWRTGITLTGPHPAARKLEWLEGDLMRAEVFEPVRLETPLPPSGIVSAPGGISVEILAFAPTPEIAGGPVGSLRGPSIKYRLISPQGTFLYSPYNHSDIVPRLIGASGKSYYPLQAFGGDGQINADQQLQREFHATLPKLTEPITRAVFTMTRKSGRIKRAHFRMENIPLPTEITLPARSVASSKSSVSPEQRPLYDRDGGALECKVEINGRPAQEGVLAVGLARLESDAVAAVEWYEAPVDNVGVARISALKAGEYRLMRIYRPKDRMFLTGDGEWKNSEVKVRIRSGRGTEPPTLRWEARRRKR